MELRCPHKLHGVIVKPGLIEVKCDSKFCGHEPGVVVLHRFDVETGDLVETRTFKNPTLEGSENADCDQRTSLRSA